MHFIFFDSENCQADLTSSKKDIEQLKQNAGKVKITEERLGLFQFSIYSY